jgi:uncharacterized protein (TIGR00369 family)
METRIERDNLCFCCGAENEKGLRLAIEYHEKGSAETSLVVPAYFSGWRKVTHGGFLSTILDEIMAHACMHTAPAVTAEIKVRFLKSVETGTRIRAVGKVESVRGRILHTRGSIYDSSGECAAEATARFVSRVEEPTVTGGPE